MFGFRFAAFALAIFSFPAYAAPNIFGKDDRRDVTDFTGVFAQIGQVVSPAGICTGILVGRDLVLTNFHCVAGLLAQPYGNDLGFRAGYRRDKPVKWSEAIGVTASYRASKDSIKWTYYLEDWAILKLKKPIGDALGWMSVSAVDPKEGQTVSNFGYASDRDYGRAMTGSDRCQVQSLTAGWIYHDCDAVPGASGSPLFVDKGDGKAVLMGLHIGALNGGVKMNPDQWLLVSRYYEGSANLAILPSRFRSVIEDKQNGKIFPNARLSQGLRDLALLRGQVYAIPALEALARLDDEARGLLVQLGQPPSKP